MQVFRLLSDQEDLPEAGRIGYLYQDRAGKQYRLTQDEVFHLRFMSLDDCVGMSVITAGKYSVELAQKGDQHGIRFYRNAARPSGVIKMGENFKAKDQDHLRRLQTSWREAHSGDDLFSVAILEGGAEWQQLGLSNEDAQWLEGRRFQINDIARLFRVPPHLIGSAIEHGHTYANVEQSSLAFVTHTMLPWISRWEQAILRDLIVQPETGTGERLYPKFNVDGLLRADATTRAKFYETMLKNRVMKRNEVRELEDMNPVEGGDEFDEPTAPAAPPGQDGQALIKLAIEKSMEQADTWATKMETVADVKEQYARQAATIEVREADLSQEWAQLAEDKRQQRQEIERCDAELTERHAKTRQALGTERGPSTTSRNARGAGRGDRGAGHGDCWTDRGARRRT
jgi:HK97 family phage portal protein